MSYLEEYNRIPIPKIREEVIDQLKLNYAHANLEEIEFERRLEEATACESKGGLLELISDLPTIRDEAAAPRANNENYQINLGEGRHDEVIVGILGGSSRSGVWEPAKYTNVISFMGGIDLDFSEARFLPGVMEISVFCVMGGLDIIVPEGINIEVSCVPIMGGVDNKTDRVHSKDAPTIRIKGLILMGGIEIKYPRRGRGKRRKHCHR